MKIDDLNVSDECLSHLRRAAFSTVEEIVEFLDNNWGGIPVESQWLLSNCFDEVLKQLKIMGIRLKNEGQNWDGTIA